MRQIVLAQRDLDLHAGIGVAPEHLDDADDRLALRRRLLDDLDDDDVAGLRRAALAGRHEQVLVDAAVLGDDECDAALLVQAADDRPVGAHEHVDDLALGPPAAIGADAARGRAVAVQHLVHLARIEEEVRAAVVGHEKSEAVRMALHGAGDEVELRDDAELALAVREQLAVALHRVDAAEERIARAPVDGHRARELRGRQRHARLTQRGEDRGARGQQRADRASRAIDRASVQRREGGRGDDGSRAAAEGRVASLTRMRLKSKITGCGRPGGGIGRRTRFRS